MSDTRSGFLALVALLVVSIIAACGPVATPEVIRDFSRANTLTALARPTDTPSGPTATVTVTSTPYIRPTDLASLDLSLPVVRIGTETITLGDYRARVRYERFAILDDIRRTIEKGGLPRFDDPQDRVANAIRGAYSRLANPGVFGVQVYDTLVREAIIRQEFRSRPLKLGVTDMRDYWIRRFGLQRESDFDAAVKAPLETYLSEATTYSGLSRDAISRIAEAAAMVIVLRPIISKENAEQPQIVTYKVQRIVTATEVDAQRALTDINSGALEFRAAACQYSVDPAVRGNGGDLGFVSRGDLTPGLSTPEKLFEAVKGAIVGPLNSPLGWHIYRINDTRKNADGDAEVRVQMIVVTSETLGQTVHQEAEAGADFARLACQYSLDRSAGTGGDMGYVGSDALAPEVVNIIDSSSENKVFGPIQTANGFEIIKVDDRRFDLPNPADISKAEEQAYNRWLSSRAESNFVASLGDVWRDAIPNDPLPRQVAPYLAEEYLGLPTLTPTPSN